MTDTYATAQLVNLRRTLATVQDAIDDLRARVAALEAAQLPNDPDFEVKDPAPALPEPEPPPEQQAAPVRNNGQLPLKDPQPRWRSKLTQAEVHRAAMLKAKDPRTTWEDIGRELHRSPAALKRAVENGGPKPRHPRRLTERQRQDIRSKVAQWLEADPSTRPLLHDLAERLAMEHGCHHHTVYSCTQQLRESWGQHGQPEPRKEDA